jgi:hypothetical protein
MGRRLLVLGLVPYVLWLVFAYEYHFIDGVNLAFHEAGHLFLTPFGTTVHVLGGTLGQLFFPLACGVHFHRAGRRFEALICGIWLAESTMYAAHYLGDAELMLLPLLGGHIHDWNYLLGRVGMLGWCREIAAVLHAGASVAAVALLWETARLAFGQGEPEAPPDLMLSSPGSRPE